MPALPTLERTERKALSHAAASGGVRRVLEGPASRAALLGISAGTAWLQTDDYVLALSGTNPIRPPNGVAVGGLGSPPQLVSDCVVGNGRIETADLVVSVGRWWDPRPVLGIVSPEELADTSQRAEGLIGHGDRSLTWATMSGEEAVLEEAHALLGRGPGLTPEGDDVLIGLLAGLRLLGAAAGTPHALELLNSLAPAVAGAPDRTTTLSVTLLGHAMCGEVAAPLGSFFRALTGIGRLEAAVSMLGGLGATSGLAMGRGALAAARHVAGEGRHGR